MEVPAELVIVSLQRQIADLSRRLAVAEATIETLQPSAPAAGGEGRG